MACMAHHDARDFQKQPQRGKTPKAMLEILDVRMSLGQQTNQHSNALPSGLHRGHSSGLSHPSLVLFKDNQAVTGVLLAVW